MMKKVLYAGPDYQWGNNLKAFLKEKNIETIICSNGKEAQVEFNRQKINFIFVDIKLEDHNATEYIKYLRKNSHDTYIGLIANKEDQDKISYLNEKFFVQNVNIFFMRPFELQDLYQFILDHTKTKKFNLKSHNSEAEKKDETDHEEELSKLDSEFSPIPIDIFINGKKSFFDVYIKLTSGRYLKILRAGDTLSDERINKYKLEKNVQHLYIESRDRAKYLNMENYFVEKIINKNEVKDEVKLHLLNDISEKFLQEFNFDGLRPDLIIEGKNFCNNLFLLVEKDKYAQKLLKTMIEINPQQVSHSFLVSLFSLLIAKQFEWYSHFMNENLGLSSLFHDVGLLGLPQNIRQKSVSTMTAQEFNLYQEHPRVSLQLLENTKLINDTIKLIILQHHETHDGKGYPAKLSGSKISPLAKIILLADEFSDFMVREKLSCLEAVKLFTKNNNLSNRYGGKVVEKFLQIFIQEKICQQRKSLF